MNTLQRLKNASELVLCSNVIRKIKSGQALSKYQLDWTLNLFNISNWNLFKEDQAKICLILLEKNDTLSEVLLLLSDKIDKNHELDCDDLTFVLYGLKEYTSYLLEQSSFYHPYNLNFII